MKQLSILQLKARLASLVSEAELGESMLITRHNKAVASLGPVMTQHVHRATDAGRGRLRPALQRATDGRYLTTLLNDRGDR